MSSSEGKITHVSDTALMVAACRAHETELEDAYIRDPFAARLAGDRGPAILQALPHSNVVRLGIAIRTRFVDELLLEALQAHRITAVLSVGCGLDTRPWRLDLAPDLRWIEVDFADMLDYKDRLMSGESPRCHRQRLTVDLNHPLEPAASYTVEALAAESSSQSGVRHWISDIATSAFSKVLGGGTDTQRPIRHVQAPDALKGEQILDVLRRYGWTTSAMRSYITDVAFVTERVRRAMGGVTPPPRSYPPGDPTGVHRFARA